jgi:hypothetical protein
MKDLLLPDLEIIGFRGFDAFRIDRLGRVNLITGRNGVGKSSLLEALRIYATRGEPLEVRTMLESRDEGAGTFYTMSEDGDGALLAMLRSLFFGRPDLQSSAAACAIGPAGGNLTLRMSVVPYVRSAGGGAIYHGDFLSEHVYSGVGHASLIADSSRQLPDLSDLGYLIELGQERRWMIPVTQALFRHHRIGVAPEMIPGVFLNVPGMDNEQLSQLWDQVALTELEEDVLKALRIVEPRIVRVSIIGHAQKKFGPAGRVPIAKLDKLSEPVSLRSLGDGPSRLFGVALALVNACNGLLLIDEIENGLHYSIQRQLWKLIFATAERLNVQVFATTHSWDCIEAFQQAACENPGSDGVLIRLDNKKGKIVSTIFDESELAIATREHIEVR